MNNDERIREVFKFVHDKPREIQGADQTLMVGEETMAYFQERYGLDTDFEQCLAHHTVSMYQQLVVTLLLNGCPSDATGVNAVASATVISFIAGLEYGTRFSRDYQDAKMAAETAGFDPTKLLEEGS